MDPASRLAWRAGWSWWGSRRQLLDRLAMGALGALCRRRASPCGVLMLQGRLDVFEPLTWFAVMFLLLFVTRPAWDLGHENFIYTGRLISPTFTKMLVAGLLAGTGFVIGYLPGAGSLASRLPRPRTLDSRRLLIWSTIVFAVALVAFAVFFVHAHGWRDPAYFFFGGRIRLSSYRRPPRPRASTSSPRSC